MRTKNKIVIFLCILITFLTANSWGWWSASNIFDSTHHNITDDSITLPGANSNYPDVTTKFGGDISDWTSGTTDDVRAHAGDALANGGPIGQWWYNAQKQYKEGNFASGDWSAYYYVGLMMHLIEDQAVPAHAYDIPHGTLGHMDNLEELVFTNYHPNITGVVNGSSPTSNYSGMQSYTLSATAGSYWRQYWNPGTYGGPNGVDVFPTWWVFAGENERNITRRLLGAAVGYTAGALMSVSENLPPLVKDLQITSSSNCNNVPTINKQTGVQVSFKILENRKKTIKIFMTVDGEAIISAEYGTGKSYDLSSGSDLPWEGTYTISWDGKLASGQYPSDGEHTLSVKVQDEDGNESEVLQHQVAVDTNPPTISISGASNGATYFMPVSLTITYSVTDDKDPNPTVTANYPSGTVFDSEGSYAVVVKAKASQCEVTSHLCEKISLDRCFTGIEDIAVYTQSYI